MPPVARLDPAMSSASALPEDTLTAFANTDTQRLAARMAQDVFASTFR